MQVLKMAYRDLDFMNGSGTSGSIVFLCVELMLGYLDEFYFL